MRTILKAPAKINLFLSVEKKREDGFHDLKMIMQSISLYDVIYIDIIKNNIVKSINDRIKLVCNLKYIPCDEKNLIYKYVKYFYEKYNITDSIKIVLKKHIPVAAGMGGGSSDAASIIMFMNKYYKLGLDYEALVNIASLYGSDIAFFINNSFGICEGKGEVIRKLPQIKGYYILIVTPNERISTKDVYNKYDEKENNLKKEIIKKKKYECLMDAIRRRNIDEIANNIYNDLEPVTMETTPIIKELSEKIKSLGALNVMMSGSGPTVYGIFKTCYKAMTAKFALKNGYKSLFVYIAKPEKK